MTESFLQSGFELAINIVTNEQAKTLGSCLRTSIFDRFTSREGGGQLMLAETNATHADNRSKSRRRKCGIQG